MARFSFLLARSKFYSNYIEKCFHSNSKLRTTIRNVSSSGFITSDIPEIQDMCPNVRSYEELYKFSLEESEKFWSTLARTRLIWEKPFEKVTDHDFNAGKFIWFPGGKLNVSVNCVDRHYRKNPESIALIWERDEPGREERITYRQLYEEMNKIANVLRSHGIRKGDRVALYLPVSPVAVATMLACARIGAVHSAIFAGFSADALASRIIDASASAIVTTDVAIRGGRKIQLKKAVDSALPNCPSVKHVFIANRNSDSPPLGPKEISLEEEKAKVEGICVPEIMDSEDPLFMLHTSGSTGQPKGVLHTQAGYLLYAAVTHKHIFDYREGDIFGCVADIGWITGHTYVVYGPLANGATTILFESTPTYPNPGRYWETIQRLRFTHLYAAPTAIRMLLKCGDEFVRKYDRSSLRVLGSVGEPINTEAWEWYHNVVGEKKCDVVDTWWQTETGGICLTPRPSAPGAEIKPAMPMRPFLGIEPALLNDKGQVLTGNAVAGALCIKRPWPGMARSIWGSHQRFLDTYYNPFPGYYFTGDEASRSTEGYYKIMGRMDDVINVTGHRLGTAEVEDAIMLHPAVSEAAVVGFPHSLKGEGVYAYIVLKDNQTESEEVICQELKATVRSKIASYAIPDIIQVCPNLPRTRSGKIMRRILRKVAANETDNLGDISTLADPTIVDIIITKHKNALKK